MKKQILSIIITLTFCLGLFNISALAAEAVNYIEYSWDNGTSALSHVTKSVTEYTLIDGVDDPTTWDGWYVVSGSVTITDRITVSDKAYVILMDGSSLSTSGITVEDGKTLVIYGQEKGTGSLTAKTTERFNAGIGGGEYGEKCGTVIIHGGTVVAETKGGSLGAGIGGGGASYGSVGGGTGGTVTIYHGTVKATGNGETSRGSAGIGGGAGTQYAAPGVGGITNIYGGTVTAIGDNGACSIGSGNKGADIADVGVTNIYGGIVAASKFSGTVTYSNCLHFNDYYGRIGQVYGQYVFESDYDLTQTLTIPEGASVTIPAGKTLTVTGSITNNGTIINNGTLILKTKDKLNGTGIISGSGNLQIATIAESLITVPADRVYDGTNWTDTARADIGLTDAKETICGKEFTYITSGWTYTISPATVQDAGTYTVTYSKSGCSDVTKTFKVMHKAITGATLGTFESMTYNGDEQTPMATVTVDGMTVTGNWSKVKNVDETTTFTANGNFSGIIDNVATGMDPKNITATVTAADKYWDDSNVAELTITLDTGISGETIIVSGVTATFDTAEIGENKTVTLDKARISYSGADLDNYSISIADTTTATIHVIPLNISGVVMGADSYTYGGETVSYDNTGLVIDQPGGSTAKAEDLIYTYTGIASDGTIWNSTDYPTKAGSYTLTVSYKDIAHYSGKQEVEFTIGKAPVIITAKNQRYLINTELPDTIEQDMHYTIEGLLGGDSIGTVTVEYWLDGEKVTPDKTRTGSYEIRIAVEEPNANYDVTYVNGTLTYYKPTYKPLIEETIGGDVIVSDDYPTKGKMVTITTKPDEGYQVDEVIVIDKNGNPIEVINNGDGTYSFKQPSGKVTITVTFKLAQCPSKAYFDLDTNLWYHEAVDYVLIHGLMNGVGNGKFDPNGTTDRAMIVTILWRLEGQPVVNGPMQFEDVSADTWYTEAVRWAANAKIVEGYGDTFGPNDAITREQFAAILWRYAEYKGYDVNVGENINIFEYEDSLDISEWAISAMQWACYADLMQGDGVNLTPKADTTRTQAAALLQRFCENVVEK